MTDTERQALNERIARRRGWEPAPNKHGYFRPAWRRESSDEGYIYSYDGPPDFIREWEYAGPLWNEMVEEEGLLVAGHLIRNIRLNHPEIETLIEATVLAFYAWKE